MQRVLQNGGLALAGFVTSILTAIAVTIFDDLTGFNFFSFSLFVVLPAGAAFCGFAAASGYYLAAKYLHQKSTKIILIQMVAIAAFTQWLIYWLEYQNLVVDGEHVSDVIGFTQYLDLTLTKAHMRVGRGAQIDTGEVGSFGYWLAIFRFVGFMVGGATVYFFLKTELACSACQKYLHTVRSKADSFPDYEAFAQYFDGVYENEVDSVQFSEHIGKEHSAGKAEKGTINLTTKVLECPGCFEQYIRETVKVFNGTDWKDINELTRYVRIPKDVDVRALLPGK